MSSTKALAVGLITLLAMYVLARTNYLLFHSIAEGFAILVALVIFVLATRTYSHSKDDFLLFLGTGYLFIAVLDFFHTLTYQGMGVFPGYNSDTPTQLWMAGRYLNAVTLLVAPYFLMRRLPRRAVFWGYALVTAALVVSILLFPVFPACFIQGQGLTPFKVGGEYAVSLIVLGAIFHLRSHRDRLDRPLYLLLVAAMAATILAEMSFTLYTDVFGVMNFVGHIFKILAYYLVYLGIVRRGLDRPYLAMSKLNAELEDRVRARTAALETANRRLEDEIAERKQAEEEQARLLGELSAVFASLADPVIVFNSEGEAVRTNPATAAEYGVDPVSAGIEEFVRKAAIRGPEGEPFRARELPGALAIREERVVTKRLLGTNARGENVVVQVIASPLVVNGRVRGAVGIWRDVTEREHLLQEATELDRLKDQFILVAAHELKTPLTIMRANTQALLRRAGEVPPERRKMVDAVVRGCDRMERIVQDLLDISRLQTGQLELSVERIPLHEYVEQVIDRMAYLTPGRTVRLVRADPVVVRADVGRLDQVLANLLDNAVRYSPGGGDVEVAVQGKNGEAVVSVRDKGVGIPRDRQERIFQRFYRAHTQTAYDYGGMGVGLYISREIITRLGGRMWFESVENQGSTFYLSLPVRG